ncbi:MAG: hypothetical protein ABFE07_29170 [Armatimonadia bacterium]
MASYTKAEYVGMLRRFLRDIDELNKLLARKESSDKQLELALDMALDDWNMTTPILNMVGYSDFPSPNLLIRGASIQVLISAGILASRNKLPYSDGGVTVQSSDQAQEYTGWLQLIIQDYERKKQAIKVQINLESCWGSVYSEYSQVNLGRW